MGTQYEIIMEDATRYLPHDPTGVEYTHYVYDTVKKYTCPITKQTRNTLVYSGSRQKCQHFVNRMEG